MDERIKEMKDIEADNLMDAIWESKMELKELGYEGWEDL